MTHTADLAFWMLGERPREVVALTREGLLGSKGFATRDLVKALMVMESGAVLHFESSWVLAEAWRNPVNDMHLTVQGESGRVDVNADAENITLTTDRYQTPFVLLDITEVQPIADFISCVLDDDPVPVTAEEGMLATQAVEAVVASYTQKRIVRIDEIH